MRITTGLLSIICLFLLATPQSMAAPITSCQDGTKAAIDGTVKTVINYDTGSYLTIETPSWDCGRVTILVKSPGTCVLGSAIHAEGIFSKPDPQSKAEGWVLSTSTEGDGAKYDAAFSCK